MFNVIRGRNNHRSRSFLCFLIVCILAVCIAAVRPEPGQSAFVGADCIRAAASEGNRFCDIASDELTGSPAIRSIVSKKPVTGRAAGSGMPLSYATVEDLLIITGTHVLFRLYFYWDLPTSHRFIITYIHNLDGMKP